MIVTGTVDPKTTFDLAQGASSLSGHALLLQQQDTLGETLASTPGVNSTYYGPGASRPIIRGLGGDRVRMLQDSVGSLDLSNISPDHNVSVEPLLLDRVEVLRGPATLLYGSSAVGGVVNVVDNRIPLEAPVSPLGGRLETRFDTAAKERTGVMALTGGDADFGLQVDGLRTRTDDVKIPGMAQQGPDAPAGQQSGTLPSSAVSTKSGSVGGTWFGKNGYLGAAIGVYDTTYGVPTGEEPPTSIDMKQRRYDLRGAIDQPLDPVQSLRVRFGYGDYTHRELSGGDTVNTTFKNKAWEGRLELIQERIGALTGTVGLQISRNDFSAAGDEVVTPATVTRTAAAFVLEEYKLEHVNLQLGGATNGRISSWARSPTDCLFLMVMPHTLGRRARTRARASRRARCFTRPSFTPWPCRWRSRSACRWRRSCIQTARTAERRPTRSAGRTWARRTRWAWI